MIKLFSLGVAASLEGVKIVLRFLIILFSLPGIFVLLNHTIAV